MRTVKAALAIMGICVSASCAGAYGTLPAHEQDRWMRCYSTIWRARTCDDFICANSVGVGPSHYAASGADEETRQRWLIRNGCPRDMVTN